MRDTSENMIEILEATKENELYFSTIKLTLNGEALKLKFGVEPTDFLTVKKVLEFRPFSDTGVAPYKYFYARSYRKDLNNPSLAFADFRVEQLTNHKQFEFQIGKKFLANLRWFEETKDTSLFEKLIITE
jgi:hypothetical protein